MSFRIAPQTPAGARVVRAAEGLIGALSSRAETADRDNAIQPENFRDMQRAGVAAAFVPEELGGGGLRSIHDWILTIATLAHGDGSAAIAICMHLSATRGLAGVYRRAGAGSAARARAAGLLEGVVAGDVLICSTATERGGDNLHPMTEAFPCDGGWRIRGEKHFVTLSPLATHIATNVRLRDDEAPGDHMVNVLMPMATPGIVPQNNWDALGMRGSGSQSVKFEDCVAPADALRKIGPWGRWSTPVLVGRTLANAPLLGAFLGIAEAAFALALDGQKASAKAAMRPGVAHALGEMEIKLATAQSILGKLGEKLDAFMAETDDGAAATYAMGHAILKDYQTAKWVVNRNAIEIVNQAMDLSGGGGYMAGNPLARLYRDVRAGPFMQPHSPVDARDYLGRVLLETPPER